LYDQIVSILLLKGQFYERKYPFTAFFGDPLHGPAVYNKTRQIRETGLPSRATFKREILKF
jgi:hypothetical protein